jgi:hypothetical protein
MVKKLQIYPQNNMSYNSQYRPAIRRVEKISPLNPHKMEKGEDEWTKICKKYDEEDKSKLTEKDKNE